MAKKIQPKYISEDELSEDLASMERLMRIIRSEYNQFFSGTLKQVPAFREAEIRRTIKKYQSGELIKKATDRFRYFNFVARFNANMEMWGRKLRMLEGQNVFGRQKVGGSVIKDVPHAPRQTEEYESILPETKPASHAPSSKAQYSAVTKDPMQDKATVQRFFSEFQAANKQAGKDVSHLTIDKFQVFLKKQADALKAKKPCDAVKFSLKVEGGDVKFTVKPAGS